MAGGCITVKFVFQGVKETVGSGIVGVETGEEVGVGVKVGKAVGVRAKAVFGRFSSVGKSTAKKATLIKTAIIKAFILLSNILTSIKVSKRSFLTLP